jgi:IMP dehydrogenase
MALKTSPSNPFSDSFSFDDVLLEPGYSEILPSDVNLTTRLGPLTLNIPILSAAMDTVTESKTAIALGLMGGLGVLHKNNSIEGQSWHVKKVKNFQHAVILKPITVRADQKIAEVLSLIEETGVSGFPVLDDQGVLRGMCTGRDLRYASDTQKLVSDVMSSPVKSLPEGSSQDQAVEFFRKHKVEKLPLVDSAGKLKGLITSKDWRYQAEHPHAMRDASGSLIVAAAVGVIEGGSAMARAEALVRDGVDALVVDSAHGHSKGVMGTVERLKKQFPNVVIIAGNIATAQGALDLASAGADVVKVGIGPGSICTTRIVSGAGMPQLSAVMRVSEVIRSKYKNVGIIADGGIRYSGDITKALAAGADAVMLGSLFAGTDESPGDTILYRGRSYKSYRGMGSLGAMKRGSSDRYFQEGSETTKLVPEGVEARVPYRGKLKDVVHQLLGGLRSGMGYVGAESLKDLREKAAFTKISPGALKESHVHDVAITSEAPNYSGAGDS